MATKYRLFVVTLLIFLTVISALTDEPSLPTITTRGSESSTDETTVAGSSSSSPASSAAKPLDDEESTAVTTPVPSTAGAETMPMENGTTPVTPEFLKLIGFQALAGNCRGSTMGRQMEISLEKCAQMCVQNTFCAGFSYSDTSQTCYLKERQCSEPDPYHPFRFYKKLDFKVIEGAPKGFAALAGNCRGHTISAGLSVSLDQCAARCNKTYNCAGFSFSVQAELCYLKAAWCDEPKTDSTYKFYKKNITDERFQLPGYLRLPGNCKGNIIGNRLFGELTECALRCNKESACVGLSYSKDESTCFLKSAHCWTPSPKGSYNYYEKLGQNKTSPPPPVLNKAKSTNKTSEIKSPSEPRHSYSTSRPVSSPYLSYSTVHSPNQQTPNHWNRGGYGKSPTVDGRYALYKPPIISPPFYHRQPRPHQKFPENPQLNLNWRFPKDPDLGKDDSLSLDYFAPENRRRFRGRSRSRHPAVVTKRLGGPGHSRYSSRRTSKLGEDNWNDSKNKKLHSPYRPLHRRKLISPKKFTRVSKPEGIGSPLIDVYGYFRFAGNCPGNYLAGSPDATSLQDCANLCTLRQDCAGFSYDPIDLMCVLKSADCWPPQPGRQIFYHKDLKWQGPSPQPTVPPGTGGMPGMGGITDFEGHHSEDIDHYQHRFPDVPNYLRLNGNCHTEILGIEEIPNARACGAHCSLYPECGGFSFNFYHYKCILRAESCMNPRPSQHSNFYEKVISPVTIEEQVTNCTRGELYGREFIVAYTVAEDYAQMLPYLEITGHRAFLGDVQVNITNEAESFEHSVNIGYEESVIVDLPPAINLSEPEIPGKTYSGRQFTVVTTGGDVSVKKGYYITATAPRRAGQQLRPSSPNKGDTLPYTYIIICQLESKYCTASMTILFNSTKIVIAGAPWLAGSLIADTSNNAQVQVTTYDGRRKSFTKPLSNVDLTYILNEGDQVDVKPGKSGILTGTSIAASSPIAIVVFGGSVARPMNDPAGSSVFGKIKAQVLPNSVLGSEYIIVCHPRAIACSVVIGHASLGQEINVTLSHANLLKDQQIKIYHNDVEKKAAGESLVLTLSDESDTIQIFSKLLDITGIKVSAAPNNTKLVVFVDLEIDSHFGIVQVPPLDHFAGRYLIQQADFRSTRVEEAVIVAVEPETQVQILTSNLRISLDRPGDTYVTPLVSDIVTSVFSTKPLIVLHTVIPDTTVRAISLQFVPTPPAWARTVTIGRPSNLTVNATQIASVIMPANQIDMLEWNGEPLTGIKVEPIMGTNDVIGRFSIIDAEQRGALQHVTQLVPFQVAVTDLNLRGFEYVGYKIRGHCSGCLPLTDARLMPVFRDIDSICEAATGVEVCGDFVDNDLDGTTDENCPLPTGYCRTVSNEGVDDFPFMYLMNQPWISRNYLPEIYTITREQNGQIFVESTAPAATETYLGETTLLNAKQTTFLGLPGFFLPEDSEHSTRGVRVRSVRPMLPISVFVVNRENGSIGASIVLPQSILGRRYFATMWSPTIGGGELGVMAVTDFTKITIAFPNPLVPIVVNFRNKIYTNGDKLTLVLPKYNTLHLVSEKAMSDLSGTEILANTSIAAFSGNMASIIPMDYAGPMNDHTFEQLLPVDLWGQVFILPFGPDPSSDDYFKITAAYPDTVVTIHGLEEGGNLSLPNTGSTSMIKVSYLKKACLDVVASKPVQIAMFMSTSVGRDPSMVMIPPMTQWMNNYVFTTADMTKSSSDPNDFTNYVVLAYRQTDHGKFVLNTKRTGVSKRIITSTSPISPRYFCTYLRLPTSGFQQLLNDAGNKFLAVVFGRRLHETYAFNAGLSFESYTPCQPCQAYYPCDNIDNDCDGAKDEEVCDGTDNDQDGKIDEDCCGGLGSLNVPQTGCYDVQNVEFCYGANATISCPETEDIENRKTLNILSAHFGRSGRPGEASCSNIAIPPMTSCPYREVYNQTRLRCEGKYVCNFNISMSILGQMPSNMDFGSCPVCVQYLRISYVCLSKTQRNCSDLATRQFRYPFIHFSASSYAQPTLNLLNSTSVCHKSDDETALAERSKYFPPSPYNCPTCNTGEAEAYSHSPGHPRFAFFDTDKTQAWCAAPCDLDHPFLQLDLGMVYPITAFILQGRRTHNHYVSQFMLSHSRNGEDWEMIMENGFAKQFEGNVNGWDVVYCDMRRFQVSARYLRMDVVAYGGHPCAHFELARCENGTGCVPLTVPHSTMLEFGSAPEELHAFQCLPGWYNGKPNPLVRLDKTFTMNCTTEGVWQYLDPYPCTDFYGCGPVPEMEMALMTTNGYTFGSEVIYSCLDGPVITMNISITCQEDGTWSQPPCLCDTFEDITDP